MNDRARFEALTYPLYRGLREFEQEADIRWLVRDSENEFWIWNADRMAQVKQREDGLWGFSSHGPTVHLSGGDEAFEFVIGVFSASEDTKQ